jgi:hypothetical protein
VARCSAADNIRAKPSGVTPGAGSLDRYRGATTSCHALRYHVPAASLIVGSRMTRKRQDCILPPLAANVPDSRILFSNSLGTGSDFKRRMERVVRIISKRSESVAAISDASNRQVGSQSGCYETFSAKFVLLQWTSSLVGLDVRSDLYGWYNDCGASWVKPGPRVRLSRAAVRQAFRQTLVSTLFGPRHDHLILVSARKEADWLATRPSTVPVQSNPSRDRWSRS